MVHDEIPAVLHEALQDEYKAQATYRKVIEKFGPIRPFINIVEAEGRHAEALLCQYERLGIAPPENEWDDKVDAPSSLSAACKAAVAAELENAAMYDRLLRQVDGPAIKNVLLNLQDASQNRHLPAFQRCLEREECGGA